MTFQRFVKKAEEEITKTFPGCTIQVRTINKLQKQSYMGLVVSEPISNVGTTLNLNRYYSEVQSGRLTNEVLGEMISDLSFAKKDKPDIDMTILKNCENIKERLFMQLIPVKGNEEMLSGVPYTKFADLAIVYYVLFKQNREGSAKFLLTNENCKALGLSMEELSAEAVKICEKNHPFMIKRMESILFGDEYLEEDPCDNAGLWVISNGENYFGSSVITYPNALERIAERLKGSFYLIPSSVHEMLALADSTELKVEDIDKMIVNINNSEVAEEERLSDHCYHYDKTSGVLESGASYEERIA